MSASTITVITLADTDQDLARRIKSVPGLTLLAAAKDPRQAVAEARSHKPDVFVIDYDGGGAATAEVARTVRQIDQRIQVIVVSVEQDVETIRNAMRAGARDYLIKPLDDGELEETIRWLIEERRDYARMSAFMSKLRKAYETMFYDDKPVPEHVVRFLENQVREQPGERLTLETLAVAYARNRSWRKLSAVAALLAESEDFLPG